MTQKSLALHKTTYLDNPDSSEAYDFAALADAPNTQRAYSSDWKQFLLWCKKRNKPPLPANPDDVASYLRFCAEKDKLKLSTILRRIAAISEVHKSSRHQSPTEEWVVRNTMKRLRRELGTSVTSKKPILTEELKAMLTHCTETLSGKRDKAILLIGFAGALRRSDLVNLDIDDIERADEGLVLVVKSGKNHKNEARRKIGIPYGQKSETCPVKALMEWLEAARIEEGPVFRGVSKYDRPSPTRLSARFVADIVKKYCALIGKKGTHFSGHSLRAGFATSAAIAGASERSIQKQTGHANLNILRRYTREGEIFKENAFTKLSL